MGFRKKIICLLTLFSAVGLLNSLLGEGSLHYTNVPDRSSELNIPGWHGLDLPVDERVPEALRTDASLFKRYVADHGSEITLYIGYYGTLMGSQFSHSPQVCFVAQGWTTSHTGKISFPLGGALFKANQLVVEKQEESELVYYWYQFADRYYADRFRMKLALLAEKFAGRDESNLFARVSVPIAGIGMERGAEVLRSFLEKLRPELRRKFFPSAESARRN